MKTFLKKHAGPLGWFLLFAVLLIGAGTQSNLWLVGDGNSSNKSIVADIGAGSANPSLVYNVASSQWQKSDNGTDFGPFGSGGGGLGVNYLPNPDFELNANDWDVYANTTPAATPETSPGGTPNVTIAQNTTAADLLRGGGVGEASKDAVDYQGDGWYTDFDIDPADKKKRLAVTFEYRTSANYVDGDAGLWLICDLDGSDGGATLIEVQKQNADGTTDNDLLATDGADATFSGVVFPDGTGTAGGFNGGIVNGDLDCRLVVHVQTTSALAYDIFLDDVQVGPGKLTVGSVSTGWESFTPTGSWTTNTTYEGYYKSVGQDIHLNIRISLSGAPNSATLHVNVPFGLNIDSGKFFVSGANRFLARVTLSDGSNRFAGGVQTTTDTDKFFPTRMTDSATEEEFLAVTETTPFTWGNGDEIFIQIALPIAEWNERNSVPVFSDQVVHQNARMLANSNAGNAVLDNNTIVYEDVVFDSAGAYNAGTGDYTCPRDGTYVVQAMIRVSGTTTADTDLRLQLEGATFMQGKGPTSLYSAAVVNALGVTECDKGEVLNVEINGDASTTLSSDPNSVFFAVTAMPTFSAGQPVAAAFASAGNYGLVAYEEQTLAADNELTGTVEVVRVNKMVTVCWDALSHSSNDAPETSAGFIPEQFRPTLDTAANLYRHSEGNAFIGQARVTTGGLLAFAYLDFTGAAANETGTISGCMSYTTQ